MKSKFAMVNWAKFLEKGIVFSVVMLLSVFGCWLWLAWRGLHRDTIWKNKVHKQLNLEEARNWALGAMQYYSPSNAGMELQTLLTNAPRPLVENYRYRPGVTIYGGLNEGDKADCVRLYLGGGMYSWGLIIGPTNLSTNWVHGYVEVWAPGIYYWSN